MLWFTAPGIEAPILKDPPKHSDSYMEKKREREELIKKRKAELDWERLEKNGTKRQRQVEEELREIEQLRARVVGTWVQEMEEGTDLLVSRLKGGQ